MPSLFNKAMAIFAFLSLLGVLITAFFLAGTGLGNNDLLSFSISEKIPKVTSQSFILMVIFLPFVAGLVSAAPGLLTKIQAWLAILGGGLLGMIIALIAFSSLAAFLLPGLFFLIGAGVSIQVVFMKKEELKNWVGVRLSNASTQRQVTLIAIGLMLWSAATLLPQQETLIQNFEKTLMETAVSSGGQESTLNEALSKQLVSLLVQNQRTTIQQIMQLPQFQALQDSNSIEDATFVQAMAQVQETVLSRQYEREVRQRVEQSANQNKITGEQLIAQIKQQVPMLETIEKWLWLVFSFGIASLFLLIGFLLQPIGMIWGFLLQKALPLALKEAPQKTKAPEKPKTPEKPVAPPPVQPAPKSAPIRPASASTDRVSGGLKNELFPPGQL